MLLPERSILHQLAVAADSAGSLILVAAAVAALGHLLHRHGRLLARRRLADGAVLALSIKTAGALLKTIELQTWDQLAAFTVILALRIFLKRVFAWERSRLAV